MSSACAWGTSLKVKTPQPSLKRRYAPKEMRAQKGSCHLVSESPGNDDGGGGDVSGEGSGAETFTQSCDLRKEQSPLGSSEAEGRLGGIGKGRSFTC